VPPVLVHKTARGVRASERERFVWAARVN